MAASQARTVWSADPVATSLPSAEEATALDGSGVALKGRHELAVANRPEPGGPVGRAGDELRPVAAGLDRQDRVGMAGEARE